MSGDELAHSPPLSEGEEDGEGDVGHGPVSPTSGDEDIYGDDDYAGKEPRAAGDGNVEQGEVAAEESYEGDVHARREYGEEEEVQHQDADHQDNDENREGEGEHGEVAAEESYEGDVHARREHGEEEEEEVQHQDVDHQDNHEDREGEGEQGEVAAEESYEGDVHARREYGEEEEEVQHKDADHQDSDEDREGEGEQGEVAAEDSYEGDVHARREYGEEEEEVQHKDADHQDSDEDREGEGDGEEAVGAVMQKIFGDSDDEGDDNESRVPDSSRAEYEGDDDRRRERDDDNDTTEWDFDLMLAKKKAEKTKRRRRRKDGGIDIINDDDGTIEILVNAMREAAKADRHSNMERQPALKKRKLLPSVRAQLLKSDLVEAMIDGGMMSVISEWLAPLPDKSLPALEIRCDILKILQSYGRLDQGVLKQSGLGKAVMLLFKHPRETKENRKLAQKLISEWARPIFQLDTDYSSMSKDERLQRDLDHMPAAKKMRMSTDEGPSGSLGDEETLQPGQKGFIGRARVPKPSTKDYVIRPRPTVEGTFKGERKARSFQRLEKATREFKERTKSSGAKRAIGVSIEGRRMEI